MKLTANAKKLLEARYLKHGETPEQMCHRVAKTVASCEKRPEHWAQLFYDALTDLRFLPNSPTLMNAGRRLGMLSACFVLPVGDSIEEIFESVKNAALIQRAGGGTGFNFSDLRPRGALVASSGGSTTGPCEFLKVFSAATAAIQQGAFKRGANLGLMEIWHPDILEFINLKNDTSVLTNFNLSVGVTDAFMRALKNCPKSPVVVHHPKVGKQTLGAKWTYQRVWNLICENAWRSGEPGVLFMDTIDKTNPTPSLGKLRGVNPCSESNLLPYESCTLASINLSRHAQNNCLDEAQLESTTRIAVRFLDNIVTVNKYPLLEIEKMCKKTRKIGLGVMGFADFLIKSGVPYASEEAITAAEKIMSFINKIAHDESKKLAKERGPCPAKDVKERRNAVVTTIAPTGSLSIIAGCSSGIEPLFAFVYNRNVIGTVLPETHTLFQQALMKMGLFTRDMIGRAAQLGSIQEIPLPSEIKDIFQTAHDVPPDQHLRVQAAFQKHTDAAVSKTINLPASATVADVDHIFRTAYELKAKGVTVYRNGCRDNQPMALQKCVDGACAL